MERDSPPNAAVLHPKRRQSLPLLNPVFLILLLPTLALLVIFVFIALFISHTQIIKTKSLDYLNIILLVIAILCGIFPKRTALGDKSRPLETSRWYDQCSHSMAESSFNGLRRNSSYPDMRQTMEWESGNDRLRFFDDFELDKYRLYDRRNEAVEKVISVDTFVAVKPPEIKHDQTRPEANRSGLKIKRKCKHKIRNIEEKSENVPSPKKSFSPPPPPPPPPPLPPLSFYGIFKKGNKAKKAHSLSPNSPPPSPRSIFNDILKLGSKSKRFLNQSRSVPPPPPPPPPPTFSSIINTICKIGSKCKRFQNQSKPPPSHPSSIFNDILKSGSKSKRFQSISKAVASLSKSVPPPPPLPPLPSSIFNNIFKSGSKSKRYQKQPASVPLPPPPPPPSSLFNNIFTNGSKSKRHRSTSTPPPPPPPPASSIFNHLSESNSKSNHFSTASTPPPPHRLSSERPPLPEKTINVYSSGNGQTPESGAQSPLIQVPVPPRPPLLLFKCSSPVTSDKVNDGDGPRTTVACPSPDVNMKADSFIARLKGEWRLEKINSVREKMNMSPHSSPRA